MARGSVASSSRKKQKNRPEPAKRSEPAQPTQPLGGFGRELANWLFPAYLGIILIGYYLIWRFGMPMASLNSVRALFIAINAATLTGFQQSVGVLGLNSFGQFVVLMLIVAGSLFSMIVGGLAVRRIVRLGYSDGQIILGAIIAEAVAILLGLPFLRGINPDGGSFAALFLSASAFGNCGLFLSKEVPTSGFAVHWIILPMAIAGGLGLPVLMDLTASVFNQKPLSKHTWTCLTMSAWFYAIGFVIFAACLLPARDVPDAIRSASVLSVESRTGGMPIVSVRDVPGVGQWAMVVLMAIGGCSAGTAGGIKTTSIAELIRGTGDLLRGRAPRRALGFALVWLGVYLGIALAGASLIALVDNGGGSDVALFNAVSAASNVGFSAAQISDDRNVMFAYSAIMLVGRWAPLMILWWMAEGSGESEWAIG